MAANARRQRQTYAKCGPRMQQSACDPAPLGSSDFINRWERIGPKQRLNGVCRPRKPAPGTQDQAVGATQGDSSHFSEPALACLDGASTSRGSDPSPMTRPAPAD